MRAARPRPSGPAQSRQISAIPAWDDNGPQPRVLLPSLGALGARLYRIPAPEGNRCKRPLRTTIAPPARGRDRLLHCFELWLVDAHSGLADGEVARGRLDVRQAAARPHREDVEVALVLAHHERRQHVQVLAVARERLVTGESTRR